MHDDTETPDSSYPEKREPVIIIHGTSAAAATWWLPGSDFCRRLDAALAKQGSAARCWDGVQEYAHKFEWSGYNSEYRRSLAAMEIRRQFDEIAKTTNSPSVHVVAHSHGGNVILKAFDWREPSCIKSVVLLGTPLYHYSSMSRSFLWRNVIRETRNFVPFLILSCMIGVSFISLLDMMVRIVDPAFSPFGSLGIMNRIFYTLVAGGIFATPVTFIIAVCSELIRANNEKAKQKMQFVDIYHIQSKYDEAVALLKQCTDLGKRTPLKAMRTNYAPAYIVSSRMKGFHHLLATKRTIRNPQQVVYAIISQAKTLPAWRRLVLPAPVVWILALVSFVWLWFDWISSIILRSAQLLLRNLAVRLGLNAIGRMALGDDSPTERIISVGRSDDFYNSTRWIDLPDAVEGRFAAKARLYHSHIATAVYRPEATYVQTTQLVWENLVGAVETALVDIGLAHCQYYQDDWCIEKVAELIACSSKSQSGMVAASVARDHS